MHSNIPRELQDLRQWVCSGPDKVPLNPRTGAPASVVDPATWGTFAEAVSTGMAHVGFVLAPTDPYTIIDLDNKPEKPCTPEQWARHQKILEAFNSYTERSASGTGYHIIIRGTLPGPGAKRDNVEVYSQARYMICTGDVVRPAPITDHQQLLEQFYEEMRPDTSVTELTETEQLQEDADVIAMGMRALNADKFLRLCNGQWEGEYPSQSEADFALLSMLAYYSKSNEQCRRLFRMSGLGKRSKAERDDYLNRCLARIRATEAPPVDPSALVQRAAAVTQQAPTPVPQPQDTPFPPGLVGELADYLLATAIRPVREVALAGALALMGGVVGRSYNVSGTGLNQYIMLIGRTGTGKEAAATGIEALVNATRQTVPMVDQFIGPAVFASGQALIKVLDERPCFVSVLGEVGLLLQQLCDPNAKAHMQAFLRVLLDVYGKSGHTQILRSSVYSDKEKNTSTVQAPAVTLLGESTPEAYYGGLGAEHIATGLVPRFLTIEYEGGRPERNPNAFAKPHPALVQKFADVVTIALQTLNNNTCAPVHNGAADVFDSFDRACDRYINQASAEAVVQLWNRAHLKALKLAALVAVGNNPHQPHITPDVAHWAIALVQRDANTMATRYERGDLGGQTEVKLVTEVRRVIKEYLASTPQQVAGYRVATTRMVTEGIVPHSYLTVRCSRLACFQKDRRGVSRALRETLEELVTGDGLMRLDRQVAFERYGSRGALYSIGKAWEVYD